MLFWAAIRMTLAMMIWAAPDYHQSKERALKVQNQLTDTHITLLFRYFFLVVKKQPVGNQRLNNGHLDNNKVVIASLK